MEAKGIAGKLLYISFDGMLEPIGRSQVLNYLIEMRRQSPALCLWLISYEKPGDWRDQREQKKLQEVMREKGIEWCPFIYHRHPRLLASAWDFFRGFVFAFVLVAKHKIQVIHTRSFMASLIGVSLQKIARTKWLYDIRGFWSDEKVDGGLWSRKSFRYYFFKRLEIWMYAQADSLVTLSAASRALIGRPAVVIPTCVDLERFQMKSGGSLIGYSGSISFSYDFDPTLRAFRLIHKKRPKAEFLILNRDQPAALQSQLAKEKITAEVKSISFEKVPEEVSRMQGAVFFIRPTFSKKASCPTKLGEFMAMGIPVLTNGGVGDVQDLLEKYRTGICIKDFSDREIDIGVADFLDLLDDPNVRSRCRQLAEDFFSLPRGAGTYLEIYRELHAC